MNIKQDYFICSVLITDTFLLSKILEARYKLQIRINN